MATTDTDSVLAQPPSRLLSKNLPAELFEAILSYLDLQSIKCLRLTSKSVASSCLGPTFLSYVATQHTDLSQLSLEHLQALTLHPVLGPVVKHVVVESVFFDSRWYKWHFNARTKALVGHTDNERRDTEPDRGSAGMNEYTLNWFLTGAVPYLANVFRGVGALDSLELKTAIDGPKASPQVPTTVNYLGQDWHGLWAHCHRATTVVLSAVAQSNVSISRLSLFAREVTSSNFYYLREGRISGYNLTLLADSLASQDFSRAGSHIKVLHLPFSTYTPTPVINPPNLTTSRLPLCIPVRAIDPRSRNQNEFPGVARVLAFTPNLTDLFLSMYNTLKGEPHAYAAVFDAIAASVRLPHLEQLSLRGMWVSENALLRFLSAHKAHLQEINLCEIHLPASYDRAFRCMAEMPQLKRVHLENLFSRTKLVNLLPVDPRFDNGKRGRGYSYLLRSPTGGHLVYKRDLGLEEIRAGLKFVEPATRARGGQELMWWIKERKILYGPPMTSSAAA